MIVSALTQSIKVNHDVDDQYLIKSGREDVLLGEPWMKS